MLCKKTTHRIFIWYCFLPDKSINTFTIVKNTVKCKGTIYSTFKSVIISWERKTHLGTKRGFKDKTLYF